MDAIKLFPINIKGTPGTATTSSAGVALNAATGNSELPKQNVMFVNAGTDTIYVYAGAVDDEADANSQPIAPGEKGVFDFGSATHLHVLAKTAAQDYWFAVGRGV